MNKLSIGLWNANGLQATTIADVLQYCTNLHILFITETWLLPLSRIPTSWTQFHRYGTPVEGNYRGSMGITALFHPSFTLPIIELPATTNYALSLKVGTLQLVCLYLPPSLPDRDVLPILDSIPLLEHTIICGDLNARLGTLTGDARTNTRGNQLRQWIADRQLIVLNSDLAYGKPTFLSFRNSRENSSIIDLFITNAPLSNPAIRVYDNLSLGSDHKLLTLSFELEIMPTQPHNLPPQRRIWHLSRLNEAPVQNLYASTFSQAAVPLQSQIQSLIENPPYTLPPIDAITDELNRFIYDSLDTAVGSRCPRPDKWKPFWNPTLQEAADHRELTYKRWRRAVGLDKVPWWERYQSAQAEFRKTVKQAKRQLWKNFCQRMESDFPKATAKVSQIKRRRQPQRSFTHPEGPAAALEAMSGHLSSVYNGHSLPTTRPPLPIPQPTPHTQAYPCPIQASDVDNAIRNLPNRKAPGADHLKAEMLKPIRKTLVPLLTSLFRLCWQWSYVSPLWRTAQVCPIHKKGDPAQPANYRPISLTSVLRKLLEICLSPTIQTASPQLDVAQGGFRPGRSALDQALCLHDLMHTYFAHHHHFPTIAFLDIKAAYDTVDRRIIWNALARSNASPPLLSLLQHLFDDVSISVLLANQTSRPFSPTTGVLQGSVLSPHLYSIYINSLPKLLRDVASPTTPTVSDPPIPINCLLYADDVAIIGSALSVSSMLRLAEQHSFSNGYRWNPAKCAVLNPPSRQSLSLYDEPIPLVNEFTYLGVPFIKSGLSATSLIKHLRPRTMLAMSTLNAIGVNRSGFSLLLSSRLYAQFIRPKFEYGLAISKLLIRDHKELERTQDKCLRMIVGGHPTSSTTVLKHICNLPSMTHRVNVLITKFCVRAAHLPSDSLLTLLSTTNQNSRLHSFLRQNRLFLDRPSDDPPSSLTKFFKSDRQARFDEARSSQILIRACRPSIGIDPILYLPATRLERNRLVRWRMGWLPGSPKPCPCTTDHTSRRHLVECPAIPSELWDMLPHPPIDTHRIDFAITSLPQRIHDPCPYWPALLTILLHVERLCNPDVDYADEESGSLWSQATSNNSS